LGLCSHRYFIADPTEISDSKSWKKKLLSGGFSFILWWTLETPDWFVAEMILPASAARLTASQELLNQAERAFFSPIEILSRATLVGNTPTPRRRIKRRINGWETTAGGLQTGLL